MPKGIEKDALGAAGVAQGQAGAAYGTVNPIYTRMAMTPQGYTPQEKADMVTRGAQSLGGGVGAAVGQGALTAARTNNAGGAAPALDAAVRMAGVQQSDNTLDVDAQDAALKRQQQTQGLDGLNGIYRDANATADANLNTANQSAANNPWMKILLQSMSSAGSAASGNLGA